MAFSMHRWWKQKVNEEAVYESFQPQNKFAEEYINKPKQY